MSNSIVFKNADLDDNTVYFRDTDEPTRRVKFGVAPSVSGDITLILPNADGSTLATSAGTVVNPLGTSLGLGTYDLTLAANSTSKMRNLDDDLRVRLTESGTLANEKIELLNTNGTGESAIIINAVGGGFDIDGNTSASSITSNSANLTISTATSGTLTVTSAGTLDMDGATVDIDASGAAGITLDATAGPVSLQGASASDFTVVGADLTLATTTSGAVKATPVGDVELVPSGATSRIRAFQKYYHQIDGVTTVVAGTNTNRASITPGANETDFVVTATSVSRYTTDGISSYFMESKRSFQQDSAGSLIPIHDTFVMTGGVSGGTRALSLSADGTSITVDLTGDSSNDCTWIGMIEVITNDSTYTYSAFS